MDRRSDARGGTRPPTASRLWQGARRCTPPNCWQTAAERPPANSGVYLSRGTTHLSTPKWVPRFSRKFPNPSCGQLRSWPQIPSRCAARSWTSPPPSWTSWWREGCSKSARRRRDDPEVRADRPRRCDDSLADDRFQCGLPTLELHPYAMDGQRRCAGWARRTTSWRPTMEGL